MTGLGYDLVELERSAGGLLRITIDHPWTSGAEPVFVTVEDCEKVTRQLQFVLEAEEVEYRRLEVSSPGIDRPLFTLAQFARQIGEQVKISLSLPQDGRRRLQGKVLSVGESGIVLDVDGREFTVAIGNVDKARLVPDLVALGLVAEPKGGRRKPAPKKS